MDNTHTTPHLIAVDFDPFAQGEIEKTVRLTASQQEIWMSCLIGGVDANCAYNESISLELAGSFDQAAMSRALREVVARHEALRSTVSANGEDLCIHADGHFELHIEDLSLTAEAAQRASLETYGIQDAETPFDLQTGPLFRAAIFKRNASQHHVRLTAHHIVCDGWSFGIILEDLAALYSAYAQAASPALATPTGFSEYANYLLAFSASQENRETEAFWAKQFENRYAPFEIPIDFQRPPQRTYKGDRADFVLDNSLVEGLKTVGKSYNASLVTVLLTAFEAYMHRLSSQEDIVIGLATAGQLASGYNNLVGHCVHLLPIRSGPMGETPYADYLRKRNGELMDVYDHQQLTLGKLLQSIQVERDSSQIPLMPFVFNVDISMGDALSFHGLQHQLLFNPRRYENFEIFLNITRAQDSFVLEWSYNTQLFKASTIQRMMAEYESLLQDIAASPEQPIARLNLLSASQVAQLDAWNDTAHDFGNVASFIELFEQTARHYPDNTAVTFQDQRLTYRELDARCNQFARALANEGVGKGDKIGIVLDRSENLIVALLGVMKAGAVYLPFDASHPVARVSGVLEEVGADFLLTSNAYKKAYTHPGKKVYIEDVLASMPELSAEKPDSSVDGDSLAYILHTSGSTGKPKGVQIMHRNLVNFLKSMQLVPGIREQDKVLAITPISFDMAVLLYLPLISGSELVLADEETSKDGRLLFEMIADKRISWMIATPSTWEMILSIGWNAPLDLLAISAGEALSPKLAQQLLERCTSVWNGYGPTETTVMVLMKRIASADQPITLGKPLANTQLYILDRYGNRVPVGQHGEIHIAGHNIGAGYYNQLELTRQLFVDNPFSSHLDDKMYRTGDLGKFDENGDIHYLGRIDNQVKIRGHRIELGEIEHTLINQRGINDAVVLALADHKGDKSLVAYLVPDAEDATGWKDRWEDLYELGIKSEENIPLEQQNLDIAIISQYYTSGDIEEQGAEWTNEGLKRIKALNAKKIIELGTGGGHLLLAMGAAVEEYVATDYSEVAISKLNEKLTVDPAKWRHVKAYTAMADDFSGIAPQAYDLVFLHGVAQYFPSLRYLQKVIENATQALKNGGCIYIGDMQTLGAISMHFYLDQLDITSDDTTVQAFREITELRIRKEEELSVDPSFFYDLPSSIPAITGVDVQIRGGNFLNEGTKCHYDIWLYVGDVAPSVAPATVALRWDEVSNPQRLASELSRHAGQVVAVKQIPNSRLSRDFALLKRIEQADNHTPIGELKKQMQSVPQSGVNPSDLWAIGEQAGFTAHVRWATDGSDGYIEAVFIPANLHAVPEPPNSVPASLAIADHGPDVQVLAFPEHQIKKWKSGLQAKLPDYMVPTQYIALNRLPLTTNGKIDRKRLPTPELRIDNPASEAYKSPSTDTERAIHRIWSKFLEIEEISITRNFFDLGGHSLIAVKIMLEIEKTMGSRLPISSLFEHSTIEKLARVIDNSMDPISWDCVIPIRPEGSKPPLFVIHGVFLDVLYVRNLLPHLDPEQPLYGIQGMGLSGKSKPFKTVEEIASYYVDDILEQRPTGPYCITGYSSGGVYAYEVARQLVARGKKVLFVGLLDAFTNRNDFPNLGTKVVWFFHTIKTNIKLFGLRMTSRFAVDLLSSYLLLKVNYRLYAKLVPEKVRMKQGQAIYSHAFRKYELKKHEMNTTFCVFQSPYNDLVKYMSHHATNGWGPIIGNNLIIVPINATHSTMFAHDKVADLANKLQFQLNDAWEKHNKQQQLDVVSASLAEAYAAN